MPTTALVIIDMQTALVSGAYKDADVLARIGSLCDEARRAGVPIVYMQHNHSSFEPLMKGRSGWQVHPAIAPLENDTVIDKTASDSFHDTALAATLATLGAEEILICGMQTEYCVDATARAALNHGFDVVLLSDCHTTGDGALPAQAIIDHHNTILPNLAHPSRRIRAVRSTDLDWVDRNS